MRILVVCVPRSGTTSFLNSLSISTKIPLICLPDDYQYPINYSLIENSNKLNDLILRIVPSQNVGTSIEEFSKLFDLTILLGRKNEKEHIESCINLYYRKNILGKTISNGTDNHDIQYDYDDIPDKYKQQFIDTGLVHDLKYNRDALDLLSVNMNKDILYYEDLYFSKNRKDILLKHFDNFNVDISKLLFELNKTKKLRIEVAKKII